MFFKSKVTVLAVLILVFLAGTLPLANPVYSVGPSELDSKFYSLAFQDFAPEAPGDGNLTRFNMGSIPPQTVWHDSSCEFLLHWDETTSTSFNASADPQPTGDLTLEPSSPSDWHFGYTPDIEDKRPFTVTITATSGDESVSQSFEITPMPKLAPEQTIFRTGQHTKPGPLDPKDVHITIVDTKIHYDRANKDFYFNYKKPEPDDPVEVRNVSIVGETVVFEEGQKAYDFNNDEDIKQMTVIGDKVIFRSPLNLPQTDIMIYARELHFEGKGQIKTTPINPPPILAPAAGIPFAYKDNGWEQDPDSGKPGGDGIDPPPSGSVTLYVKDIYPQHPSNIKLDLRGANGGNPGRGWPGTGSTWEHLELVKEHHEWVPWPCKDVWYWHPSEGYDSLSYVYKDCPMGKSSVQSGTITLPKDGLDAVPAGMPGLGGTGGTLKTTANLPAGIASLVGGISGRAENEGSKYSGGKCNGPWKVEQLIIRTTVPCVYKTVSRTGRKTKCGASALAPYAEKPGGDKGKLIWDQGHPYAWLHPLLLNRILNQAKNDYLGDRIEEAESVMKYYVIILDAYREHQSWAELTETDTFEMEQMYNEMQTLLHRIASGLDYYGNPPGWVPMLSFEVNKSAFEDEIGRAIRQLYLAYWIKNKVISEQARVDALSDARERLREEITRAKADYEAAVAEIPILYATAQDLQKQTTELQYKLQEKEQELEKKARDEAVPGQMLWAAWTGARIGLKIGGMMCSMLKNPGTRLSEELISPVNFRTRYIAALLENYRTS